MLCQEPIQQGIDPQDSLFVEITGKPIHLILKNCKVQVCIYILYYIIIPVQTPKFPCQGSSRSCVDASCWASLAKIGERCTKGTPVEMSGEMHPSNGIELHNTMKYSVAPHLHYKKLPPTTKNRLNQTALVETDTCECQETLSCHDVG